MESSCFLPFVCGCPFLTHNSILTFYKVVLKGRVLYIGNCLNRTLVLGLAYIWKICNEFQEFSLSTRQLP